ncbi:MAG: ABC transporter ATP-binding protein, partial [Acidimicrobiales bacterium]
MNGPLPRLKVVGLAAGYGRVRVLREVDLHVDEGEIVALVGANGAGKSTLLRCLAGLHPGWTGRSLLDGRDITRQPAHRLAASGVSLVPEGRELFAGLSVADNLRMGLYRCADPDSDDGRHRIREVLELFPALGEHLDRRAGTLSGGQQQMLALAR